MRRRDERRSGSGQCDPDRNGTARPRGQQLGVVAGRSGASRRTHPAAMAGGGGERPARRCGGSGVEARVPASCGVEAEPSVWMCVAGSGGGANYINFFLLSFSK